MNTLLAVNTPSKHEVFARDRERGHEEFAVRTAHVRPVKEIKRRETMTG
jgi:hypothetical protein